MNSSAQQQEGVGDRSRTFFHVLFNRLSCCDGVVVVAISILSYKTPTLYALKHVTGLKIKTNADQLILEIFMFHYGTKIMLYKPT